MKYKTLLLILIISGTQFVYSQSGWFWQNPLPQGNDLFKIYMFDANTGICIDQYNIIRTSNSGENWQIIYSAQNPFRFSVSFINQNTGYMYLDSTTLIKTINGGSGWSSVYQFNSLFATQIYFINNSTGFILSNSRIFNLYDSGTKLYRTTSGGESWNLIITDTNYELTSIIFPSQQIGYAIGYNFESQNNMNHTKLFRTTNSGITWDSIQNNIYQSNYLPLPQIDFINDNTGFITGKLFPNQYGLFKTTNSGANWTMLNTNFSEGIGKIQFVDQNNGYVSGVDTFYKTTNGGQNWSSYYINQIYQNQPLDYSVIDVNNIILSGTGGFIAKSTNGGINWSRKSKGIGFFLNDIRFCDMNTGIACGDYGALLKTTNGGANWTDISFSNYFNNSLVSISNAGNNIWYVASYFNSNIYKSTNTGLTWDTIHTNLGAEITRIKFLDANTGVGVCKYHYFFKTTDGGQNLTVYNNVGIYNFGLDFIDANTGFISGTKFYKTINGGVSWDTSSFPPGFFDDDAVQFIDANTGFVIGAGNGGGELLKTTNGGNNWQIVNFNCILQNIFMLNEQYGFVTDWCGNINKTTNGGLNWYQLITNTYNNYSIFFIDSLTGFSVGPHGCLLKTTTGGEPICIQTISKSVPSKFILYQNYPNPFNPTTKIKFQAPLSPPEGGTQIVSLIIYDLLGREITALFSSPWGRIGGATYEFTWDGSKYASGVYFYQLRAGDFLETKKLVLLK